MAGRARMRDSRGTGVRRVLLLSLLLCAAGASAARQDSEDADLEALVAPIALYPDDLLAVVLPASTHPLQVVQAARFLEDWESDGTLQPDPDWDDSIVALLNYPEVLERMNQDLDWTWALGEAVIEQESEVLAAVADFREQARNAGNLRSDDRQIVEVIDRSIEIRPANPQVIYVPYYEPERVVVYQPVRVVHYYPRRYPVYYYPYPVDYPFYSNRFWGVTSAFSIGWTTRHLHLHYREWDSHPYYGFHYPERHYYRRPTVIVYKPYSFSRHSGRHHAGSYWQRSDHPAGARARHRSKHDHRPAFAPPVEQQPRRQRQVATAAPVQPGENSAGWNRSRQRHSEDAAPQPERREQGTRSGRSQQKATASRHENDELSGRFLR